MLAVTIKELQAAGCESLRAIAGGLDDRGIPAVRGDKWSAVQVARLLEGLALAALSSTARPAPSGEAVRNGHGRRTGPVTGYGSQG